jgi:hypothetical protein
MKNIPLSLWRGKYSESHDDIFHIINWLHENQRFESSQQTMKFAVGLKLFVGVMLKNKDLELFKDFFPAFVTFMKKLKGK